MGKPITHFLTLALILTIMSMKGNLLAEATIVKLLPASSDVEYRIMDGGDPFQLCSGCRCCSADDPNNGCSEMSCCYHIDCDLPDKPYGVCALTPHSCDCTDCSSS